MRTRIPRWSVPPAIALMWLPLVAQAKGSTETIDKVALVLACVVLVIAPVIGIVVFVAIHVQPEQFAEKRHHPQAKAIQVLCLPSLVFGGMRWPIAWLWAFTKPTGYRMA